MNTDRVFLGLFVFALMFLAFLAGAFAILGKVFPYQPLHDAYLAATALQAQRTDYATPFQTDLWRVARTPQRGVTIHDRDRTDGGYTLYTSSDEPCARLIDMDGRVIHEWCRAFSTVWNEQSPVREPRPDRFIYMRKARMLPNGDLIAVYIASGDSPWGYGVVKLDRDSNILWRHLDRMHHDVDIAPDGRVYALAHRFSPPPPHLDYVADPYVEDSLVILSPDGEPLKRISLMRALLDSRYDLFRYAIPAASAGDPLHTNTVHRLSRNEAAALPHASEGDVLLSFREIGAVAVFDVQKETIVWATRGPWFRQHDPSVLANGNLLVFDNMGGFRPGNGTRILEVDPHTLATRWQYSGSREHPLDSDVRGAAQRLDNGNTLITESDGGRLLEVTPAGDIVWEYINPIRGGEDDRYIPVVSWGRRIKPADLQATFRAELGSDRNTGD